MKVAMVSTAKTRGGAARMASTLANGVKNLDASVAVQFYHCDDYEQQEGVTGLKKPFSRELNAMLARVGGARLVFDAGVADQIIKETQDADILHIHNLHGYYLNYEKLLTAWKDRPILWTWHDMWGATGRCGISFDCNGWQIGCGKCEYKEYYPAAWFDFSAQEFKAKTQLYKELSNLMIVSPSDWLRDIAIKRGFSSERVYTVPNPVDLNSYQPNDMDEAKKSMGLDRRSQYVLFIAADCNNKMKGYDDFLAVIEKTQLNGLVVGKPPEKKSDKIFYAGAVNSSIELSKYYSAADVMIITSKQDNYPNTVVESMACGTPVLGYAVGGIPSQMPDFWDGVVPVNDVNKLAERLKTYIEKGGKSNELQSKFRLHAEVNSSPESVSRQYLDLYKELLNKKGEGESGE